ncbi:hypothetical protein CLOM_g24028 [Closterium sp. NIES-68]|nr:hypothetical protein CLOM_g24028 [Closterium sp. NIES-68]GJP75370.1 hypothetical protein CLOP_g5824 [Closterium sp. NIES-67]
MARWAPHSVLLLLLAAVALLAFFSFLRAPPDHSPLPHSPSSAPASPRHGPRSSYRRRLESRRGNPGRKAVRLHAATAEVNPRLEHITFDPLVAEMEARRDDRKWEEAQFRRQGEEVRVAHSGKPRGEGDAGGGRKGFEDAARIEAADEELRRLEDSPDSEAVEHKVNVTNRLRVLFPLIDSDDKDGFVSLSELAMWQVQQGQRSSVRRTRREMQVADSDGDGRVSLKEYLHDDTPGEEVHVEGDDEMAEFVKMSRERFALADADGDGLLNEEEFNDLLHPEDSQNEKLVDSVRDEELRSRDTDGDMRLSFEEFLENVFEEVAAFDEEYERWEAHRYDVQSEDYVPPDLARSRKAVENMSAAEKRAYARTRFDDADSNHDGYLDASEFEDLLYAIVPNEYHFAEEQAKHMMTEADDNKDKRLSLEEMLAHWDVFYDAMDEEGDDSYDWASDDEHDEFR